MATLTLRPNSAGTYQAWSTFGSPSSHWEGVSDESDSTGVTTSNTSEKETFNLENPCNLGTINSVTAYMRAKATGSSTQEAAVFIWRTYNTDYEGTPFQAGRSGFANYSEERDTNPDTGSDWTWTEVAALQIGARAALLEAMEEIQVSEFWIVVDYNPIQKQVADSGSGAESISPKNVPCETHQQQPTQGQAARVVEVIRVGSIDLQSNYPGEQIVRLIDRSMLYEGGSLAGLSSAKAFARLGDKGMVSDNRMVQLNPTAPKSQNVRGLNLYYAVQAGMILPAALEDLHDRIRGKRLSSISVDVWDQISGAYLGPRNTDHNGTLVLPTDARFVEVLQWKLAGGGYSDAFNGERAAGTPGLITYFPCNEFRSRIIDCFPGISGQRVNLGDTWDWYESGYFNRPALRSGGDYNDGLIFQCADPVGFRSFQFLYYCADPTQNYTILGYGVPYQTGFPAGTGVFSVRVENGVLVARAGGESDAGSTNLQAGKWYLIQVNTEAVVTGIDPNPPNYPEYSLKTNIYIGSILEANATKEDYSAPGFGNAARFICGENDGLDEIRHMGRELYADEISNYSTFTKLGRITKKSAGKLGSPGW